MFIKYFNALLRFRSGVVQKKCRSTYSLCMYKAQHLKNMITDKHIVKSLFFTKITLSSTRNGDIIFVVFAA